MADIKQYSDKMAPSFTWRAAADLKAERKEFGVAELPEVILKQRYRTHCILFSETEHTLGRPFHKHK